MKPEDLKKAKELAQSVKIMNTDKFKGAYLMLEGILSTIKEPKLSSGKVVGEIEITTSLLKMYKLMNHYKIKHLTKALNLIKD